MAIESKIRLITPETAKRMLAKNVKNRGISERAVTKYANSMRRGEWVSNGESLKFDRDGKLLDGQHRLHAIINSKTSQRMMVITGLPPEVFETIDTGKSRNSGDVLSIYGYHQAHALSSVARKVYQFCDDHELVSRPRDYTNPQIVEFVLDNPEQEWRDAVSIYGRLKPLGHRSLGAAMFYLFARVDRVKATLFFDALITGTNLGDGDPVLALRNKLFLDKAERSQKLSSQAVAAAYIRTWNAFSAGRKMHSVRCKTSDFPRIRGLDYDEFVLSMLSEETSAAA